MTAKSGPRTLHRNPPDATISSPVSHDESLDARKTAMGAMSSGSASASQWRIQFVVLLHLAAEDSMLNDPFGLHRSRID